MKKFIAGKIWLACCFMLALQSASAQKPGYLGHRVWVGYDYHSSLGLFGQPFSHLNPESRPRFFWNSRHSIHGEYALSARFTVGVTLQSFRTGKRIYSPFTYLEDLHARMRLKGVGASIRWYATKNRGSVAPLGVYSQMEIVRFFCRVTEESGRFWPDGNTELGTYPTTAALFTFGRTFLTHDRLLWDFGLQTGFSPGWISVITTSPGAYYKVKLRNSIHFRTTGNYFLNFRAGLSYLF